MRLIDPTKTRLRHEDTEYGPGRITYRDHFNGSQDATVRITGLRINLTAGAPPDKNQVAALHELEEAQREWRIAKHSQSEEWKTYAATRLRAANERMRECQ